MIAFCKQVGPDILNEQKVSQLSKTHLGRTFLKIFSEHALSTVFQPIVDLKTHQVYAVEALTRGPEQSPLYSPLNLFGAAAEYGCLDEMDWLARQVAIANYKEQASIHKNQIKLFLNVTVNLLQKTTQSGRTLQCLKELGISPEQVVIELTELQPVEDYEQFLNSIQHYREMGFLVAVDDLGSGYNGLRIWSEVKPDFVKIDRHFIQDVNRYPEKKNFLEVMLTLSQKMGTKVIAEGIESEGELRVIETLGVDYVQGFLLAKPQPKIVFQPKYLWSRQNHIHQDLDYEETVGSIAAPDLTIPPDYSAAKLDRLLLKNSEYEWVAVLNAEQKPVGMIYREEYIANLARPYIRELYTRKTVADVMDKEPYIFDEKMDLIAVSRLLTSDRTRERKAFIITEDGTGKYKGVASFIDLLKAMTNLQIQSAQHANPLSGLPGNKPIQKTIKKYLSGDRPFVVIYVDVDNFKPFNDYYSFDEGDQVIVEIAHILTEISNQYPSFVGHIGGDDFVVIMDAEHDYERVCELILTQFRQRVVRFYSQEDQKRGGIEGLNRQGEKTFFPLMSLSLGVLKVHPEHVDHPQKLASEATKAKKTAKNQGGNTYFVREI